MKTFFLTICYTLMLASVMVFRGCSSSVETSRNTQNQQLDGASGREPRDPPADPNGTPPPASKVPVEPEEGLPGPLKTLRNKVSKAECEAADSPQGEHIKEALDLLKCRVDEQLDWLANPLLYEDPGTTHSCVTQTEELNTNVLTFVGKDSGGSGAMWLQNACRDATDKALENLGAIERYEATKNDKGGGKVPTEASLKRALVKVLTKIKTSKYADFDDDPDSQEDSHNIALMLEYSLNRINHNCADHMDTEDFLPRKIEHDESQGNVEVSYIFREYIKYPAAANKKIDPWFARYYNVLMNDITTLKAYAKSYSVDVFKAPHTVETGETKTTYDTKAKISNLSDLALFLNTHFKGGKNLEDDDLVVPAGSFDGVIKHKESRDIIPIRKIDTQCTACDAYKRHQKSSNGDKNAAQTTFFDHSNFDIEVDVKNVSCDGDGSQKNVIPSGDMCEADDDEEEEREGLASDFGNCRLFRNHSTLEKIITADPFARGIQCHNRTKPTGSTLSSYCGALTQNDQPKFVPKYCEEGSYNNAVFHKPSNTTPSRNEGHGSDSTTNTGCHTTATEDTEANKKALTKELKTKDACVFTLVFNGATDDDRIKARRNLAHFLGVKYADLNKCQLQVDENLTPHDYKQYDLCASKYTLYTDGGDGDKLSGTAKTELVTRLKKSKAEDAEDDDPDPFDVARTKYCSL